MRSARLVARHCPLVSLVRTWGTVKQRALSVRAKFNLVYNSSSNERFGIEGVRASPYYVKLSNSASDGKRRAVFFGSLAWVSELNGC